MLDIPWNYTKKTRNSNSSKKTFKINNFFKFFHLIEALYMHKLKWHIIVCNFWLFCACFFLRSSTSAGINTQCTFDRVSVRVSCRGMFPVDAGFLCSRSAVFGDTIKGNHYLETSPWTSHLMQARNWEWRGYLYKKLQCLCVISKKSLRWTHCACHFWISVCLSGLMFSLRNCSTDFHDIWHWRHK